MATAFVTASVAGMKKKKTKKKTPLVATATIQGSNM